MLVEVADALGIVEPENENLTFGFEAPIFSKIASNFADCSPIGVSSNKSLGADSNANQ